MELGIPCVTLDLGSMKERIISDQNGFVLSCDRDFVDKAVELPTQNSLWSKFHQNLYNKKVNSTWIEIGKKFVDLF
ncbi:glycosyltransferase [Algoriphagus sanaruensis]|uniref:Glycosyl transferase family 1 domain-containing protein n=1 Tax=Algoriphagus sanaruensis TaxID=1727163 RepID=A0A142EQT6_9BACT|nr:hypothetical protein AO498_13670 [Algoriphagus sanaruensis]